MNSRVAKSIDSGAILHTNIQAKDILSRIEEQYGPSNYGSIKYTRDELYWIGYIYRYFSYTYDLSSVQVYKIVKAKELRVLFLPYHTLDPANAITRILEAKNLLFDDEKKIKRQYEIFKKNRQAR
ncbi:MAG TPA: antitoxin [Mogibacterium sp.]|nr:antitoxin [Mogibacterium sp.]